jgi:hypothetical protein
VIDNHSEHSFVFVARFPYQAFDTRFKAFLGIPGCIAATIRPWCNSGADAYSKVRFYIYIFDAGLILIFKEQNAAGITGGMIFII